MKHLKMTTWTSVLWKMNIHIAKQMARNGRKTVILKQFIILADFLIKISCIILEKFVVHLLFLAEKKVCCTKNVSHTHASRILIISLKNSMVIYIFKEYNELSNILFYLSNFMVYFRWHRPVWRWRACYSSKANLSQRHSYNSWQQNLSSRWHHHQNGRWRWNYPNNYWI